MDKFYLALAAALIRLVYFFQFQKNAYFHSVSEVTDSFHFHQGAIHFLQGDWLARTSNNSYSPFYKYFVALLYGISNQTLAFVWIVQFIIGIVGVVLLYEIGRRVFGRIVGIVAAALYLSYGPTLMYEGVLLRESLLVTMGIVTLFCALLFEEKPSLKRGVYLGLALSAFLQIRPTTLFIVIFVFAYFRRRLHKSLLLSFVLASLPLLIIVFLIHGRFVLYDASGPSALYAGNLISYSGQGFYGLDREGTQKLMSHFGMNLSGFARYFTTVMGEAPWEVIKLYGRKLYFLFGNFEVPSNYNFYLYSEFSPLLKLPHSRFAIFFVCGTLGLFLSLRKHRSTTLLFIFYIGFFLATIPFHNEARFRLPWVPLLILLSAFAVKEAVCLYRQRQLGLVVGLLTITSVSLFLLGNSGPSENRIRSDDHALLAMLYAQRKDLESLRRAESACGRAWNSRVRESRSTNDIREGLFSIYRKMLDQYSQQQNEPGMVTILQKILEIYPEDTQAQHLLEQLQSRTVNDTWVVSQKPPWFPFEISPW